MSVTTENKSMAETLLSSINTADFTNWDSDSLMALWTAKFGNIQHANLMHNRLKHLPQPKALDDELYFEAVGAELFKRKLLTRVVDSNFCTLVPRGSNADR
jgi:hypothetical protein